MYRDTTSPHPGPEQAEGRLGAPALPGPSLRAHPETQRASSSSRLARAVEGADTEAVLRAADSSEWDDLRFNLVRAASGRTLDRDRRNGRDPGLMYVQDLIRAVKWAIDFVRRKKIPPGSALPAIDLIELLLLERQNLGEEDEGPARPREFDHDPQARTDWTVGLVNYTRSLVVTGGISVKDANRILQALRGFSSRAASAYPLIHVRCSRQGRPSSLVPRSWHEGRPSASLAGRGQGDLSACSQLRLQTDVIWAGRLKLGEIDTLVLSWDAPKTSDVLGRAVSPDLFRPGQVVSVNGADEYVVQGFGVYPVESSEFPDNLDSIEITGYSEDEDEQFCTFVPHMVDRRQEGATSSGSRDEAAALERYVATDVPKYIPSLGELRVNRVTFRIAPKNAGEFLGFSFEGLDCRDPLAFLQLAPLEPRSNP